MKRTLLIVLVCALAFPVLAPGYTNAAGWITIFGPAVPCNAPVLEGGLTCYPPRSQALAESGLAVKPINPVPIVQKATSLHLVQLRLVTGFRDNRGVNLLYGFGKVCWTKMFTCPSRYVIVGEAPGPTGFTGHRMVRDKETTGAGSSVRYGPWTFLGYIPHRNLGVAVYGPFSRAAIRSIGMQILDEAGKSRHQR